MVTAIKVAHKYLLLKFEALVQQQDQLMWYTCMKSYKKTWVSRGSQFNNYPWSDSLVELFSADLLPVDKALILFNDLRANIFGIFNLLFLVLLRNCGIEIDKIKFYLLRHYSLSQILGLKSHDYVLLTSIKLIELVHQLIAHKIPL